MAPQARGGLITTVIAFLSGIWLFLAPFLVEYQKVGQDWIDATKNDLWTGGALIAISALTLLLFAAFSLVTIGLLAFDRDSGERSGRGGSAEPLPGWLRGAFGAVAVFGAALALFLWIHPGGLTEPSPFALPPLGGGFAGSWVALLATVCGWAAARNRLDESRPASYLLCLLPAGALIAGLRTIDQLDPAGAAIAYLAVLAVLAAVGGAAIARTPRGKAA